LPPPLGRSTRYAPALSSVQDAIEMDDIGGATFIEDGRARRPCQVHVGRWLQDHQGDRRACGRRLAARQPGVHEDMYLVPRHAWFAGRKPTLAYRFNREPQIHARHDPGQG
jgi:hypothetical protein